MQQMIFIADITACSSVASSRLCRNSALKPQQHVTQSKF